ncbi:hypothetical protein BCR39DRAFT_591588 [Naematelia encephala]|uniref:Uncharacterized protein n=1 Tax=Naematelia encephala TaxID=71784 RepID=A0A1Y2AGW6_9TREE|nr:hypothetical protein BCR39DRAFT_591588 [Naematelia encephala]
MTILCFKIRILGSSVFTYAFSYMLRREGRAADEVMEARRTEVSSRETEVSSREVDVSREVEAIRLKTKRDVAVMSHLSAMFPTSRTFGTLGELLIEVDRICQNGYFPDLVQKFRGQKGFYPDFLHTKQIHETIKTIVHIADAEWRKYTLDDVLTEADLYYTGCVPFLEHSLDDLTTLLQYRTASQITFKDIFDHPDFAIDPAATDPRVIATHFFKWMEVVRNWRRNNSQVLASTAIATATEALATAIATMTATETEKETATGTGTGTEISTAATDILTTRSLMSVPATETAIVTEGPTRRSLMSRLSPFKSRSH